MKPARAQRAREHNSVDPVRSTRLPIAAWRSVATDQTSKFAFANLHESAKTATSRDFLRRLIEAVPYKAHTVLTGNGIQFTTPGAGGSAVPLIKEAITNGERFWAQAFEYACATNDIDHWTTKPEHPGSMARPNA